MTETVAEPALSIDESESIPRLVDHLFRHHAGQVVSTLTRIFGPRYIQLAEDVVQDTMIKALRQWTYHGVPANPYGWMIHVARNEALDVLRRQRMLRNRQERIVDELERWARSGQREDVCEHDLRDDQLRMIFLCCHPANSRDAQVALTLKTMGGFGVAEIARAFLVPRSAVAQRLVRAKRTLRERNVSFDLPPLDRLSERLDSVLDVLYALFNEGYSAHAGTSLIRIELCAEAIRLTSLLSEHSVGRCARVDALLALMLLQAARLPARTDSRGDLLVLEEQDRSRWDTAMIAAGMIRLGRSGCGEELTVYHLEAEIAACHVLSSCYAETPWDRILRSYDTLVRISDSPIAALNRVVALAMVEGVDAGLEALREVRRLPGMDRHYLMYATAADLHRRRGDRPAAAEHYRRAAELTGNEAELRFLRRRLEVVTGGA